MSCKVRNNFIIITLILIDLFTKQAAKVYLYDNSFVLLNGFINFRLCYNTGLFYGSLNFIPPNILIIVNILLLIYLDKYFKNYFLHLNKLILVSRICLFSGGLANIMDRFFYKKVTDFIFLDFYFLKTNIFNFADLLILISCTVLLYILLSNFKK